MTIRWHDDAPDALFDVSPASLAARFGRRAIELMRVGRDPYEAVRLAAYYARQAQRRQTIEAAIDEAVTDLERAGFIPVTPPSAVVH